MIKEQILPSLVRKNKIIVHIKNGLKKINLARNDSNCTKTNTNT